MSWQTEDGHHEGYAAYILKDGRESWGTSHDGLHMDYYYDASGTLPWSELLGWEARCSCGWSGPMYRRAGVEHDADEHEVEPGVSAEDAIHTAWTRHSAVVG